MFVEFRNYWIENMPTEPTITSLKFFRVEADAFSLTQRLDRFIFKNALNSLLVFLLDDLVCLLV